MNKYHIGQKVRLKHFDKPPMRWVSEMRGYMGEIFTIKQINQNKYCYILEDDRWLWRLSDFEEVIDDFLSDKDMLL